MGILSAYPWSAWVIALIFVYLWTQRRQRLLLIAGLAWALFGGFQTMQRAGLLCRDGCMPDVNGVVLYAPLAALSIAAVVQSRRRMSRQVAVSESR
jgi:hypothetical protein